MKKHAPDSLICQLVGLDGFENAGLSNDRIALVICKLLKHSQANEQMPFAIYLLTGSSPRGRVTLRGLGF